MIVTLKSEIMTEAGLIAYIRDVLKIEYAIYAEDYEYVHTKDKIYELAPGMIIACVKDEK